MTRKTIKRASLSCICSGRNCLNRSRYEKNEINKKLVKSGQRNEAKKEEPEIRQTSEQSAREMVVVVKRWVTEWKERKATLMY
jgi:hypothetical protein